MLTTNTPRAVSVTSTNDVAEFTIKASGKAFKVLIDGLYSDKIRAVIRELWTNAYDSHVMAGKADVPFECHLPSVFEPHFSVRDYGVGMDHETIMTLYSQLFNSSKEDTNQQVGKLGLGSKSPFAYTDTFSVTAFDGTEKRMYSAFIGSDHVPRITLMGRDVSDEPAGIEVMFPVRSSDTGAFIAAAGFTRIGFDVQPVIQGAQLPEIDLVPKFKGTSWKILAPNNHLRETAYARQGCVIYPLDVAAIDNLSTTQQLLLDASILIDFPIGDLEISASRESLGYDAATRANIVKQLNIVEQEIVTLFQNEINACSSASAALRHIRRMGREGFPKNLVAVLMNSAKYKGRPIKSSITLGREHDFNRASRSPTDRIHYTYISHDTYETKMYNPTMRGLDIKWSPANIVSIDPGNILVVFEDTHALKPTSMAYRRIFHYWKENHKGRDELNVLWVKGRAGSRALQELLVLLGRPDWIDLASLPKPPANENDRRTKTKCRLITGSYSHRPEATITDADDVVYVMSNRSTVEHGDRTFTQYEVVEIFENLRKVGIIPSNQKHCVAIPASCVSILNRERSGEWIDLFNLAKRFVDQHYDHVATMRKSRLYKMASAGHRWVRLLQNDPAVANRDCVQDRLEHAGVADLYFRTLLDIVRRSEQKLPSNKAVARDLAHVLNRSTELEQAVDPVMDDEEKQFIALTKKFNGTYPMLGLSQEPNWHNLDTIVEYINTIDSLK